MKLYGIGNALLYFREKEKLSQDEVCNGICPVATLSRIETGNREYDSLITETLMSRIGKTVYKYEFVLDDTDYFYYDLRMKIEKSIKEHMISETERLIHEYEAHMPEDKLHKQYILLKRFQLGVQKNESQEKLILYLQDAIQITKPDEKSNGNMKQLFSTIEIEIIYQLFLYHVYSEERLDDIIGFMETYYDIEQQEIFLIPIYLKLLELYEQQKKYHALIEISQKAIDIKCAGRNFDGLADLYFCQVKAKEKLYGCSESLKEMCKNIYYVYLIEENEKGMKEIQEFSREKLQCQITTPEISFD